MSGDVLRFSIHENVVKFVELKIGKLNGRQYTCTLNSPNILVSDTNIKGFTVCFFMHMLDCQSMNIKSYR